MTTPAQGREGGLLYPSEITKRPWRAAQGPERPFASGRATDERSEDERGHISGERRALRDNKRAKRAPQPAHARSETEEGGGGPPDEGPENNCLWHSCGATDERGARSEEGAETEEEEGGGVGRLVSPRQKNER